MEAESAVSLTGLVCVLCGQDWSIPHGPVCVCQRDKSGRRGDLLRVVYLYA